MADKTRTNVSKFTLAELMAESELLYQCKPELLVGAAYNCENSEFSIVEMQQMLEEFLSKEAKL